MTLRKKILVTINVFGFVLAGCSGSGAGLAGGAKPTKAEQHPKDAAAAGSGTAGATAAKDQIAGGPKAEDADADVKVIPPEVVSGAYLACERFNSKVDPAPAGEGYFGCTAMDASKRRVKLKGTNSKFTLRDSKAKVLDLPEVTVNDPAVDMDVTWSVKTEILDEGLSVDAEIPGVDAVTKKSCKLPFTIEDSSGRRIFQRCIG